MKTKAQTVPCPTCGKTVVLKPHPVKQGRLIGECECNPLGPVIETNAPRDEKEEVE